MEIRRKICVGKVMDCCDIILVLYLGLGIMSFDQNQEDLLANIIGQAKLTRGDHVLI